MTMKENAAIKTIKLVTMTYVTRDVNLIMGEYVKDRIMTCIDINSNQKLSAYPTLGVSRRDTPGNPIDIWFQKSGSSILMHIGFLLSTKFKDVSPFKMASVKVRMHVKSSKTEKTSEKELKLEKDPGMSKPDFTATYLMDYPEFEIIKKALTEGGVSFKWEGTFKWMSVTKESLEKLKSGEIELKAITERIVEQTAPITVDLENKGTYDRLKGVFSWEQEEVGENTIFYKDALTDNTYYFLPQIYRIMASETNRPWVKITLVAGDSGEDADSHVNLSFQIGPYVHPKAKRDLYKIIQRKLGVAYCHLKYGGYEYVKFEWSNEMKAGYLHERGIIPTIEDSEIKALPGSYFSISFKCILDIYEAFMQELSSYDENEREMSSIHIGDVYFWVKSGMNNELVKLEPPIKVELNLSKLTNMHLKTEILESDNKKIQFPYKASLTNTGEFPLQIGGCSCSYISAKDKKIQEVAHDLEVLTKFPITLGKDQSCTIELSDSQIDKLNKKNKTFGRTIRSFFGLRKIENYWTELICEPYKVTLLKEDILKTFGEQEEINLNKIEKWTLTINTNFNWSDFPNLNEVSIQVKNKYGIDKVVTLNPERPSVEIVMAETAEAIALTQQASNQIFEYRIRTVTSKGRKWSEWVKDKDSFTSLYIYSDIIKQLISTL